MKKNIFLLEDEKNYNVGKVLDCLKFQRFFLAFLLLNLKKYFLNIKMK